MVEIARAIFIAGGWGSIICGAWNAPYENKETATDFLMNYLLLDVLSVFDMNSVEIARGDTILIFFYETGNQQGINPNHLHLNRLRLILARLDASQSPQDMNLPGLHLHALKGELNDFWAVSVSGNWRLIFRFEAGHPADVDYLDYH